MNWLELFPGETGMVYKGVLMNWKDEPLQAVAVKTLKGNLHNQLATCYINVAIEIPNQMYNHLLYI